MSGQGGVADCTDQGVRHFALLYRDIDDYLLGIADFLQTGAAAGEPALIAVPGAKQELVRRALERRPITGELGRISPEGAATLTATRLSAPTVFTDMSELGQNPARIIPAIQSFIDAAGGGPIRFVGEPIRPGRGAAEVLEATKHEALINQAFGSASASILCPFDVSGLPDRVTAEVHRIHPVVISNGQLRRSQEFAGLDYMPAWCDDPLPGVPADATVAAYARDLRSVRTLVADEARRARLPKSRAVDLVLAVSEVSANTLRHTAAGGTISLWLADGELICQLADTGQITDTLAGRKPPNRDHPGGQGLWLVNQVCDLVELRTGQGGTVVRLHMRLPTNHARP